ncbi:Translational activator GCN1 [Hordeum vulgare]|nr:Translational activator GCN1 [Hordeum vulgare]
MSEFPGTPYEEAVLDGPEKSFEHVRVVDRKRKRGDLIEEVINAFTNMTEVVKEVATAIRERKSLDIHIDMCSTGMELGGFSGEALMAALSHVLDNKAQSVGFIVMADAHRVLWLKSWLEKHYY